VLLPPKCIYNKIDKQKERGPNQNPLNEKTYGKGNPFYHFEVGDWFYYGSF
jgi:hypothetical protein